MPSNYKFLCEMHFWLNVGQDVWRCGVCNGVHCNETPDRFRLKHHTHTKESDRWPRHQWSRFYFYWWNVERARGKRRRQYPYIPTEDIPHSCLLFHHSLHNSQRVRTIHIKIRDQLLKHSFFSYSSHDSFFSPSWKRNISSERERIRFTVCPL